MNRNEYKAYKKRVKGWLKTAETSWLIKELLNRLTRRKKNEAKNT